MKTFEGLELLGHYIDAVEGLPALVNTTKTLLAASEYGVSVDIDEMLLNNSRVDCYGGIHSDRYGIMMDEKMLNEIFNLNPKP